MSNAKIGMMINDLPHVEYAKKKKEGYNKTEYDACVAYNLELDRKLREAQELDKGVKINLNELI